MWLLWLALQLRCQSHHSFSLCSSPYFVPAMEKVLGLDLNKFFPQKRGHSLMVTLYFRNRNQFHSVFLCLVPAFTIFYTITFSFYWNPRLFPPIFSSDIPKLKIFLQSFLSALFYFNLFQTVSTLNLETSVCFFPSS